MHFSANISTLFTEVPLKERFALAAKAGFKTIEIQFPYALNKEQIKSELEKHNLTLNLINIPAGNIEKGELGIACLPGREKEFEAYVEQALDYANYLNVPKINCLSGKKPDQVSDNDAQATFLHNLAIGAKHLAQHQKTLLIEPINTHDIPSFFLHNTQHAVDLITQLDVTNIKLQYDCYHMQIMEGNLINTLTNNIKHIGHIQIADVPKRSEPGSGEINFPNIFNALRILGYTNYIGLEYFPINGTLSGLSQVKSLLNLKGEQS
jgi:hydroxypyruvate isomerase